MPCASVSANRTFTSVEKWKPSTSVAVRAQQRQVVELPEDLGVETSFAQPLHLVLRGIGLVVAVAQRCDGDVGQDDVREHEAPAGPQGIAHSSEEILLLDPIQMVDRERGD